MARQRGWCYGGVLVYDALADDELAIVLLRRATNGKVDAKRFASCHPSLRTRRWSTTSASS